MDHSPKSLHDQSNRADALVIGVEATPDARATTPKDPDLLTSGGVSLRLVSREAWLQDRPLYLTQTEFELLRHFVQRPRWIWSRTQLLEEIWGYIETVRGIGYRFADHRRPNAPQNGSNVAPRRRYCAMRSKEPVIGFLAAAAVALLVALTLAGCGGDETTTTVTVATATTSAAATPTTTGPVPTAAPPTTAASVSTTAAAPSTTTTLPAPTVLGTIAFTNRVGKGDTDICIVNTDGTGLTTVVGGEGYQYYPRWSPDGSRILYTEQGTESQQPSMDLWVVNADGSGKKELYDGPIRDAFATWSPDGKQIAWTGFTQLHNIGTGQPDRAAIFS